MDHVIPLHEVRDQAKLRALTAAMRADGWVGRPLLGLDLGTETVALTGSHRLAAARDADIEPPVYLVDVSEHTATNDGCSVCGEACWVEEAIEARDDDDRLDALRRSGDGEAITLMEQELVGWGWAVNQP